MALVTAAWTDYDTRHLLGSSRRKGRHQWEESEVIFKIFNNGYIDGIGTGQMKHKLQLWERMLGLNNPKTIQVLSVGLNALALDLREAG